MVEIPKFKDIPYGIRKNPEKRWNYLADLLNDDSEENTSSESQPPVEEQVQPTTRDISITVNDGTDPVQGATVTIGEVNKTTGSAGGCTFNDVTEGTVSICVQAEGYENNVDEYVVDETHTSFTISLTAVTADPEQELTPGDS